MRPIIIAGDSHVGPIRRGWELLPDAERSQFTFWPLGKGSELRKRCHVFDEAKGEVRITAPTWDKRIFSRQAIGAVGQGARLFVSLPMNTSRILRDVSWHSHAPWRLARGEAPLSDLMVERLIDEDSIHAIDLVKDIARICPDVAVIEAPRFFPNARYLGRYRFDICRHVDAAYRARVGAVLAEAGISVVAQPAGTITDQGTTDLRFDHEDPRDNHHANAAYGRLVLDTLVKFADGDAGR